MGKKVLILSGSPRKGGNSDYLCDQFLKGAQETGHDVEKIFIGGKNIGYCRACYACRDTHKCFQQDDMEEILAKMVAADVLVLASPVYFYSVNAQIRDLSRPQPEECLKVPGLYDGVAVSTDGSRAYVSDWRTGTVREVDVSTGQARIIYEEQGIGPADIAIDGGTLYIPELAGSRIIVIQTDALK